MAVSFTTKMDDILHQLTDSPSMAQLAMTEKANKKHQPHGFQPGDSAHVNTRHFQLRYANSNARVGAEGGSAHLSRALSRRFMASPKPKESHPARVPPAPGTEAQC